MNTIKHTKMNASERLRRISAISVFTALSYICVFLIRFKVSFLTFDLKDAIMAIGAMYFGPASAVAMPAAVSILEFLTVSETGIYGLIMNFISSLTFCITASLVYSIKKTLSGAIVSLISSAAVTTAVMMAANLIVTPYYTGVSTADVRAMIPTLLLPFNLTKSVFNAAVVMLIYKPFSNVLKYAGVYRRDEKNTARASRTLLSTQIAVTCVSLVLIIAALVFLFLYLKGSIVFG